MKPTLLLTAAGIALTLTIAACVPQVAQPVVTATPAAAPASAPTPAPSPTPTAPVATVQSAFENWADAPQTPGDWGYRGDANGSVAEFVSPAGATLAAIECSRPRGQVIISAMPRNVSGSAMTIRTETAERTLRAAAMDAWIEAEVRPSDPLLDAIAFSRGRFALETAGNPGLYLPAWPEITRVIEDCR